MTGRACPTAAPVFAPSGARGSVLGSSILYVPARDGRGLSKLLLQGRLALSSWAALMMPRSTHLSGDRALGFHGLGTAHRIPEKVYKYMKIQ